MAILLKGKNKGKEVQIWQMSNDWISTDDGKIINPTSLKITEEEKDRLLKDKFPGMFWGLFKLVQDGDYYLIKKQK